MKTTLSTKITLPDNYHTHDFFAFHQRDKQNIAEIVEQNIQQLTHNLLTIKGIGIWTINYALLRGFNYLNGSLHGDVAVRRNIQRLINQNEKVSAEQAEKWLANFAPWKALLAAHLWRQESSAGY
ncbi:hypothetical protein [Photorhabdus temperata]|uniref:HhH-GPD domain-containing protein n=1 Tax=Photorhabdus temperata J3 TaxID=1389415 RepID=U7R0F6_PHOTE|nr:hypothetical protein [Photorhabdus temperata]ERT13859.1 hypothetical protein O185_06665 [Photorhabdus temperata J3]